MKWQLAYILYTVYMFTHYITTILIIDVSYSLLSMSMSASIYTAHCRTVPLMRSVHRVLLKQMRLKQATEVGDAEIWIAQIVAECVPDGQTDHVKARLPYVSSCIRGLTSRRRLAKPSKVLSFGDLCDRRAQLGQVVRRLTVKAIIQFCKRCSAIYIVHKKSADEASDVRIGMCRRRDKEEMDAKQQAYGATRAMQHLLLVMPVREENWFEHLIDAMKTNGYQHIVNHIYRRGTAPITPIFASLFGSRHSLLLLEKLVAYINGRLNFPPSLGR